MARIGDFILYPLCWAAFRLCLIIPTDWRLWWALLPYAGSYAHSTGFADYLAGCDRARAPAPADLFGGEG